MKLLYFILGDLVYLITNTDGQTRVKVCEQSKLTQEDWKIIDRTLISSHILDNYATMVRLGIIRDANDCILPATLTTHPIQKLYY